MSQTYRVRVSETMEQVVHVDDGVVSTINLLPILDKKTMANLLSEELVKRGFSRNNPNCNCVGRSRRQDVNVEVNLDTSELKVSLSKEMVISASGEKETSGDLDFASKSEIEERGKKEVQTQLKRQLDVKAEEVKKQATSRLAEELRELRSEIDEVINAVTSTALKLRAGQIGQIEDITEDNEGNVKIMIRV